MILPVCEREKNTEGSYYNQSGDSSPGGRAQGSLPQPFTTLREYLTITLILQSSDFKSHTGTY